MRKTGLFPRKQAGLITDCKSKLLFPQLPEEFFDKLFDAAVLRNTQFLAQAAPFVVEGTDVVVIVQEADSVLGKSETEQAA